MEILMRRTHLFMRFEMNQITIKGPKWGGEFFGHIGNMQFVFWT